MMRRAAFVMLAVGACEPGAIRPLPDTGGDDDSDLTIDVDPGDAPWICDAIPENGTCTAYTGNAWDEDVAQQDCVTGDFQTGALCPPPTLGVCTMGAGQPLEQVVSYYLGEWFDEDRAEGVESNCGLAEGTWQPAGS